jgi:hypothetical protein
VCWPSSLLTVEGRGKEPNHKTARKPGPLKSIKCSPVQCTLLVGVSADVHYFFRWSIWSFWLQIQSVCSHFAVPKCMQSCSSAKVYALCSLVAVPKCKHYAVLLLCQSVCTMQSCCCAKVYALCCLVAAPKCMPSCCSAKVYAVLLQCQSVCSLVAVPKCMQSCCSATVYTVLLQCQSVCRFVAVPKCIQSCCCAKVYALCSLVAMPKCMHYAVLLQCQSACRFVAVPENLQFLQRGVSRSQRILRPDHRRHLPLRGQQIPLQEVTTILYGSRN